MSSRALILPPLGHDSVTYHGPKIAMWIKTGGSLPLQLPGGWALYRYYPPGGEALGAWAMLPFGDDTLYLLVDVVVWLGWLPNLFGLCRELDIAPRLRAPLCLLLMVSPAIYYFTPSGYVDVTTHLLLISTLHFALRFLHGRNPAASACLAVLCASTAVTVKITALLMPALTIAVFALAVLRQRKLLRPAAGGTLAGAILSLGTLGTFLIGNLLEQGYPLSPYGIRVLGLTLGQERPELRWYSERTDIVRSLDNEIFQTLQMLGLKDFESPTFGVAATLLLLVGPLGIASLWKRRRLSALLLTSVLAVTLWQYTSDDFEVVRNAYGRFNARFFYLAPTLGALLVAQALRSRLLQNALIGLSCVGSTFSLFIYFRQFTSVIEWPALLLFAVVASLALASASRTIDDRPHVLFWTLLGLSLGALVLATPALRDYRAQLRYSALAMSKAGHRIPIEWAMPAPAIDHPDQPRRIAISSAPLQKADRQLMYFYMGRRLQNELVYVSPFRDGSIPTYDGRPFRSEPDAEAWLERLRVAKVSHVVVLAPAFHELKWMMQRPQEFEPVAGNRQAVVFHLRN